MFSDHLSYVAIISKAPVLTAGRLSDVLGLARASVETSKGPVEALAVGRSALVVLPAGHPVAAGRERAGVDHIAIAVEDPTSAAAEAEQRGFRIENASAEGLARGRVVELAREDLDGVRTVLAERLSVPASSSEAVTRIDHLGIASQDAFGAITIFHDRLGLPLESTQTDVESMVAIETFTSDRYGVVHHSRPARIVGGLRVAFLTVGDCELEFLQNLEPEHGVEVDAGRSGTTKQDQGAITKYISRHGPGLHHIALKTNDINGTLARADAAGLPLIDSVGRPGSRHGSIGFFHPDAFGGVLFHLVERPDA